MLGPEDEIRHPSGPHLRAHWIQHRDTSGAWQRRPSDPEAVTATGLFGSPACLSDSQQIVLPARDVIALESTRGTFLSWAHGTQSDFTAELRELLATQPAVHLTRQTSGTMAQRPSRAGP